MRDRCSCMCTYTYTRRYDVCNRERCNRRDHLEPNLTNHIFFLQTAVVVLAELSNVVKRKANCMGLAREL